jgi:hypothetical protein
MSYLGWAMVVTGAMTALLAVTVVRDACVAAGECGPEAWLAFLATGLVLAVLGGWCLWRARS